MKTYLKYKYKKEPKLERIIFKNPIFYSLFVIFLIKFFIFIITSCGDKVDDIEIHEKIDLKDKKNKTHSGSAVTKPRFKYKITRNGLRNRDKKIQKLIEKNQKSFIGSIAKTLDWQFNISSDQTSNIRSKIITPSNLKGLFTKNDNTYTLSNLTTSAEMGKIHIKALSTDYCLAKGYSQEDCSESFPRSATASIYIPYRILNDRDKTCASIILASKFSDLLIEYQKTDEIIQKALLEVILIKNKCDENFVNNWQIDPPQSNDYDEQEEYDDYYDD